MNIHPTAVVEDGASLDEGVTIGPHAVVGPHVRLGAGVIVGANVVLSGRTTIGAGTRLSPGVVLGEPPQDFSYRDEPTELVIGERCVMREHVTIHVGTQRGRGRTVIGDEAYFMVGSHVGHDCIIGNGVTLSNNVLIGGHAELGNFVLVGGGTAILQRARIGNYAFVSGLAGVTRDIIPYAYATGRVAWVEGLNLVGLKRRGFDRDGMRALREAYAILFEPGANFRERQERLRGEMGAVELVRPIIAFMDAAPNRPVMQSRRDARDSVAVDLLESGR